MSRFRQAKRRHQRKRVLILVEGSTGQSEQRYFQELARLLRHSTSLEVKVFPGMGEPSKLLRICLGKIEKTGEWKDYDDYCLVSDTDRHEQLRASIQKAHSSQYPIKFYVTNPEFELWLLWHHQEQASFIDKERLEALVKQFKLVKGKNGKELGDGLKFSDYKNAVDRARKAWPQAAVNTIGPNPSSALCCLVDLLEGKTTA